MFWVALPSVRGTRSTSDMRYLNDLFRGSAEKAGIVYVDLWDGFVDENGRFTSYGPDFAGQTRRLRTSDGVHFTKAGARKIAHYVEREIRRAMTNRAIPVALPSQDEDLVPEIRPGGPTPRPLAGPVVPLTASTGVATELLGGASTRSITADPVAARVLVRGKSVAAPSGRADYYAVPEVLRPMIATVPASGGAISVAPVASNGIDQSPGQPAPATVPVAATPSTETDAELKNGVRIIRAPRTNPANVTSTDGVGALGGARIIQVPQNFVEPAPAPVSAPAAAPPPAPAASLRPPAPRQPASTPPRGQSGRNQDDADRRAASRAQQPSPAPAPPPSPPSQREPSSRWGDTILRPPAPIGSGR